MVQFETKKTSKPVLVEAATMYRKFYLTELLGVDYIDPKAAANHKLLLRAINPFMSLALQRSGVGAKARTTEEVGLPSSSSPRLVAP